MEESHDEEDELPEVNNISKHPVKKSLQNS